MVCSTGCSRWVASRRAARAARPMRPECARSSGASVAEEPHADVDAASFGRVLPTAAADERTHGTEIGE